MFFNKRPFIEEFLRDFDETFIIVRIKSSTAEKLKKLTGSKDEESAIEKIVELFEKYALSEEIAKEVIEYVRKYINKNVNTLTEAVRQLLADNEKLRYELEIVKKNRNNKKQEVKSQVITSLIKEEKAEEKKEESKQPEAKLVEVKSFEKVSEVKTEVSKVEEVKEIVNELVSEKLKHLVITYETVSKSDLFTPTIQFIIIRSDKANELWKLLTSKFNVTRYGIYKVSNESLLIAVATTEISKGKETVNVKQATLDSKCIEKILTIDDVEKNSEYVKYLHDFIQFFKEPLPLASIKEIEKVCR